VETVNQGMAKGYSRNVGFVLPAYSRSRALWFYWSQLKDISQERGPNTVLKVCERTGRNRSKLPQTRGTLQSPYARAVVTKNANS